MNPSHHSIPIHRAANRPVLLLGCDRELIGLVIGSSIALIWIGQTWSSVGYGVFLFLFSLGVLRLAAKADPYMRRVYMRSRRYKRTYLARSTPFVDTPKKKNGSLARYRSRQPGFCDLLNWAAVPEDGIVLGKDGSLMAGWVYEGEDESSRTDEEQALVSFRINEALKRLGNGWMLHVTSTREEAAGYPARGLSHFPDPVTAAIDEEPRREIETRRQMYQRPFTLLVTLLPPTITPVSGFPNECTAGLLPVLAGLPLEYGRPSRYLFLDRHEASGLLKTYRKKWRQKMRGIFSQIFPNPNAYVNADAKMMSEDAKEALVEIESGDTAGGYYTSTIVVFDEDRQKVEAVAKQVEKAINNAGFTARVESLKTMDALIGSLPGHGVQKVRRPYASVFNLAHLIPTSSIWTGEEKAPCPMYPALSPALMHCVTKGHTPFRLNLHARDVGHTIIFGPTGKGKSTLLALIIAQLCRYRDMSIFVFDKGMSIYPLTTASGGSH